MAYAEPLPGLPSEISEPYFALTIGIIWSRFEQTEKTLQDYRNLWERTRTVGLMAVVACDSNNGTRSSLACSNSLGRLSRYIESKIGICPVREWK
jgi:hypothetical protein